MYCDIDRCSICLIVAVAMVTQITSGKMSSDFLLVLQNIYNSYFVQFLNVQAEWRIPAALG